MLSNLTPEALILGPRPGKKSFAFLSGLHLTHCCTLLSEREDVAPIKKISGRLGCQWLWMPIEGGNLDALQSVYLTDYMTQLDAALTGVETPKVYVHCSAGIHRTGFFAYVALRVMGLSADAATVELAGRRQVTGDQVGAERLDLAERMLGDSGLLG